ncbi:MAG: MarR family winged helix-turn-helix transcriptional regulator [Clostridia bacterium]|nr:MarR family winged helix-turn-helix transcriptional regulator [Clostridia bacterium]
MAEQYVFHELKCLVNSLARVLPRPEEMKEKMKENNSAFLALSPAQAMVAVYICEHKDRDICAKDLEEYFACKGATISKMLANMEKQGAIRKVQVDGRKKKLIVSDEIEKELEHSIDKFKVFDDRITEGISDDEMASFYSTLDRIKANIEGIKGGLDD